MMVCEPIDVGSEWRSRPIHTHGAVSTTHFHRATVHVPRVAHFFDPVRHPRDEGRIKQLYINVKKYLSLAN